jgi:hypothetical protein
MSGLQPAPRHAPARLRSTADLRTLQRLMTHAIVRPLAAGDRTPKQWIDGRRSTAEVVAEFIKPNETLTAVERIEIYHRVYWFRLIGAATDDCPGLQALLGPRKFERLIRAYLAKYPSRSFTLRDLCSRLPEFVRRSPRLTRPHSAAARAVARFEWAQTESFDGPACPPLTPAEIQRISAPKLRVRLQPYLSLHEFDFPVDRYVLAVKERSALRSEASNAREGEAPADPVSKRRSVPPPRRAKTYLAVHRFENRLYYKRLDRAQYRILQALQDGQTIVAAVAKGGRRIKPAEVQEWFATWMRLGWLCRRARAKSMLMRRK